MERTGQGLSLTRSALATNLACNFRCRLCGAYAPYYETPQFYQEDRLFRSITEYFAVVDRVEKFTITGGEPLLNQALADIFSALLQYEERIGSLEIITNGSLKASEELLKECRKTKKLAFLIDDYGPELSRNVSTLAKQLEENHITYQIRTYYGEHPYCGGWVDYGDLSRKWETKEQVQEVFDSCIQHKKLDFCLTIVDGKLFPCSVARRCMELGIVSEADSPYVDLLDEHLSVEEKRKKIRDIFQSTGFSACAYCNGFSADSKRYPPAEQLERSVNAR